MIRNIIFDLGGVLVDWNPEYVFRDVFEKRSELEHFLKTVCSPEWNERQDAGRSLAEATLTLQQHHPDYHDEIGRYYDEWPTMLRGAIEENVALLAPVKANYRLFGLTNWSAETFPIACDRFSFFNEFEGIVVSGLEKLVKPDPAIYLLLLERYGLSATECLFIDDKARNTTAAANLGFRTLHLTSDMVLEKELINLGIRGLSQSKT